MSTYREASPVPVAPARKPETVEDLLMEFGSKMARQGHQVRRLSVDVVTMAKLRSELGDRARFQGGRLGDTTIVLHTSAGSLTIDCEQP